MSAVASLYEKGSYLQEYGHYVILAVVIILVTLFVVGRLHLSEIASHARSNWPMYRCNPIYAPFAGMINPTDGETSLETTAKNFEYCTQSVLTSVTKTAFAPIYYSLHALTKAIGDVATAVNDARGMFAKVRGEISDIVLNIVRRIQNIVAVQMTSMIITRNFLSRSKSILDVGVAVVDTLTSSLVSVFGSVTDLILKILIVMAATIIALWATFIVGWPMAAALTAVMIAIMVPFMILEVFGVTVLHQESMTPPGVPHCFARGSLVDTAYGKKPIEELEIGDVMADGAKVTGTMVLSSSDQVLYEINGVFVTAEHRVEHGGGLIKAKHHPSGRLVSDFREPFVYCANTTSKRLHIHGMAFVDWDDLDASDMRDLQTECAKRCVEEAEFNESSVHRYLEAGLSPDTTVELDDGRTICIKDVQVNDVLRFGQVVRGTVVVDVSDVETTGLFRMPDGTILGATSNVSVREPGMSHINTYDIPYIPYRWDRAYHLVTSPPTFMADGVRVGDYNSGLEDFLHPSQHATFAY